MSYPSPATTESVTEALDMLYERRTALDQLIDSLEQYRTACSGFGPAMIPGVGSGGRQRLAS